MLFQISITVFFVSTIIVDCFRLGVKVKIIVTMTIITLVLVLQRSLARCSHLRARFLAGLGLQRRITGGRRPLGADFGDRFGGGSVRLASILISPCSHCVNGSLNRLSFQRRFNIGIMTVIHNSLGVCVPGDSRQVCPRSGLTIINASQRLRGFHSRVRDPRKMPNARRVCRRVGLRSFAMGRTFRFLSGDVIRSHLNRGCSDVIMTVRQGNRLIPLSGSTAFLLNSLM